MTDTTEAKAETNRDRVRRILLGPLGFRAASAGRHRMTPEEERAFLNGIADDLSYLPDQALAAMVGLLRGKGEGERRDFWPSRACILGHAEFVHPLPIEADPALMRWFASIEGPKAIEAGTLVETWAYVRRTKTPPYKPEAQEDIRRQAAQNASRLQRIAERRADGRPQLHGEEEWERGYLARREFCLAAVQTARAGKDAA